MTAALEYLRLPTDYGETLGAFRWSSTGDCVEYADGRTFVFQQELTQFLEGFASRRPLIAFPYILHLLHLFGKGRGHSDTPLIGRVFAGSDELSRAFARTGRPLRNAGAFCALLCQHVPSPAQPPELQAVCGLLASGLHVSQSGGDAARKAETPPLGPLSFEAVVAHALRPYSAEDLDHWLRTASDSVKEEAERVGRELLVRKPPTLSELLNEIGKRERWSGALPFVAQMIGALALPPRRLARQQLPLGGYADVTTRGHPEQILISQLALDGSEFVRRFAENELLFYRREEPRERTREDLVLVLDQGVRTWGSVRLLLAGAVLALGEQAARRRQPFYIATTRGRGRLLDARATDADTLGCLVEVSDLSANPGLALERVLEEKAAGARDVVLLTHPRNLAAADVLAAARRVTRGTRLFGLTALESGDVCLSELRRGNAIELSKFQVDLTRKIVPAPAPLPAPGASWHGDVEPIPFPFRFGIACKPIKFDFDDSGDWLLTSSGHGILHLQSTDGSVREILPRAKFSHGILTAVQEVLGVVGGFAVAGIVGSQFVVAHYQIEHRHVRAYRIGLTQVAGPWTWYYFREENSIVARMGNSTLAVDLSTGNRARPIYERTPPLLRAEVACGRAVDRPLPSHVVWVGPGSNHKGPHAELHEQTGIIQFYPDESGSPLTVAPQTDGKPNLMGLRLLSAHYRGGVLAATFARANDKASLSLRAFGILERKQLIELQQPMAYSNFALSSDGRLLARQSGGEAVEVRDTASGAFQSRTLRGQYHNNVQVQLGPHELYLRAGGFIHHVEWANGRLTATFRHTEPSVATEANQTLRVANARTLQSLGPFLGDLRWRFVAAVTFNLTAVVDRFGQIALLNRDGALVCMFFAFRRTLVAWMPDGTYFSPAERLGRPPTRDAQERIGAALRDAEAASARADA